MKISPPNRSVVLSLFLILLTVLLFVAERCQLISIEEDAGSGGIPSLTGFVKVKEGGFCAIDSSDKFHSLAKPIVLTPNSYYRIGYDILNVPNNKVIVTSDFYAPGYDRPEQELSKAYGMNVLGTRQSFLLNSGPAPSQANFRLFYSGPPGLEISNVRIIRLASWWVWLKRATYFAIIVSFIIWIIGAIMEVQKSQRIVSTTIGYQPKLIVELPAIIAVYFAAVLVRYIMYLFIPYWSGDEYLYKSIASGIWHFGRHGVLTEGMVSHSVDLPTMLYPYLISPAFVLEENFYFGIRLINALVMNAAIFPVYLIARRFLERWPALLIAGLSMAIPFVNIGAFAVTEVLFFPFFLLSILSVIEALDRPESVWWNIVFGALAAILLNIRLNALVLLPAYLCALFWLSLRRRQGLIMLYRPYWLVAVLAFAGIHFLLQYYLGVNKPGTLGLYSQVTSQAEGPFSVLLKNPSEFGYLVLGHLTTLAIPYALPIALMLTAVASGKKKWAIDTKFYDFLVVSIVFSIAFFALALVFTISVSQFDLGGLGRWHSRYYFYFYPLIFISGAVLLKQRHLNLVSASSRFGVALAVVLMLAANIYFVQHGPFKSPWFGSTADNMDVQWYCSAYHFYWFFISFTFVILWLWLKRSRCLIAFVSCFIFSWAIVANYGVLKYLGIDRGVRQAGVKLQHATPTTLSAPCGALVANFLDHRPGRFVVVGDSSSTMVSTGFWIPFVPEKTFIYPDSVRALTLSDIGVKTDYLVVNGNVTVNLSFHPLLSVEHCVIYKVN